MPADSGDYMAIYICTDIQIYAFHFPLLIDPFLLHTRLWLLENAVT